MTRPEITTIDASDDLRTRLRGELIEPTDSRYDEVRQIWNGLFDKYPAAIARCAGVADVIESVNFAREEDLLLAVRSGGHDYAGKSVCDGGLVIDLSSLTGVRVDRDAKTARVEPGVTWSEFYHETEPFGLSTPGGLNGVGVAGFTLGGGIGYLSRKYGFTADNLRSADVVTADGRLIRASEDEHPDLFWALQGGGGNFGIVTSFEFDLHEVGSELLVSTTMFPHESLPVILRTFREVMPEAPDELMSYASVSNVPDQPVFPEEYRGSPAVSVTAVYCGEVDAGKSVLQPIYDAGDPIVNQVDTQTLTELSAVSESGIFYADRFYSKSQYLNRLSNGAIETIAEYTRELPGTETMVAFGTMGGAINRVDPTETAIPHRDAAFEFDIWPAWSDADRDQELMAWARNFHDAMTEYAADGVYVNLLSHDEADRVEQAYRVNYGRLRSVKTDWDPTNLFRMNHNIQPDN